MIKSIGRIAWLLLFSVPLIAQSRPAAQDSGFSLWGGAEVSTLNPDWGCKNSSPFTCWNNQLLGLGIFADANHVLLKLGVEGGAKWLNWRDPQAGLVISNYLVGPRYEVINSRRISANVKFLIGQGRITLPSTFGKGNYLDYAPGATLEYRLARRLNVRGDYEYQIWPNFSGLPTAGNNGLTPNGFSIGVSYRILR